jgi:hypothetical protein
MKPGLSLDRSGPLSFLRLIIRLDPPVQRPQICSEGLEAASGPAPRGTFCFGLLTAAIGIDHGKPSQNPFVSKPHDIGAVAPIFEQYLSRMCKLVRVICDAKRIEGSHVKAIFRPSNY